MTRSIFLGLALAAAAPAALAQTSNIDDANKHAWAENIGFTNWRDADSSSRGVHVYPTHLTGAIWAENTGWIRVGSGPLDGVAYSNKDESDYGINVDVPSGELSGYAWGENIGWVNFKGGANIGPDKTAMYLYEKRRLAGYVWGENVGWINLDHSDAFVAVLCYSDFDANSFVNGDDFDSFVVEFEAGSAAADIDGNGFTNGDDFDSFVAAFESGC